MKSDFFLLISDKVYTVLSVYQIKHLFWTAVAN